MTFEAKDPVALTQALVRCVSVTPDEGGALTLLQDILSAAGFTCHRMTFTEPGTPDMAESGYPYGVQPSTPEPVPDMVSDLPPDHVLGVTGILHLVAHRDPESLGDEPGDVPLRGLDSG